MATKTNDVVTFLKNTKIKTLFDGESYSNLVTGYTTDTALMSFRKLIEHKLLSIPLFSKEHMCFVAFFDILDVLHYVTSVRPREQSALLLIRLERVRRRAERT